MSLKNSMAAKHKEHFVPGRFFELSKSARGHTREIFQRITSDYLNINLLKLSITCSVEKRLKMAVKIRSMIVYLADLSTFLSTCGGIMKASSSSCALRVTQSRKPEPTTAFPVKFFIPAKAKPFCYP